MVTVAVRADLVIGAPFSTIYVAAVPSCAHPTGASQFLSRSRSDLMMVAVAVQATVNNTKMGTVAERRLKHGSEEI